MKGCVKAYFITLELVDLNKHGTSVAELNNVKVRLITQLMQLVKISLQRTLHDKISEQHSDNRNCRKSSF